jgi:hypothetical protein
MSPVDFWHGSCKRVFVSLFPLFFLSQFFSFSHLPLFHCWDDNNGSILSRDMRISRRRPLFTSIVDDLQIWVFYIIDQLFSLFFVRQWLLSAQKAQGGSLQDQTKEKDVTTIKFLDNGSQYVRETPG